MINTRDLLEEREDLKTTILFDFNEVFPQYGTDDFDSILFEEEEIQDWKELWSEELDTIERINSVEDAVGSEFEDGVTLIEEDEFEDYCRDLIEECGYISKDFPSWIEIDWSRTTDNIRIDYSEVEYQGTTYLFRV